jgi:pimeloyl-ACP methyl ester carboxylesterase
VSPSIFARSLVVLGLAAPVFPQGTFSKAPVPGAPRDAGTYHVATGTWTRTGPAAFLGPDVIYSATAPSGYFGFGWEGSEAVDEGILPGTGNPLAGFQDFYRIDGFQFGYCSWADTIDWAFSFYDGYTPCDLPGSPAFCQNIVGNVSVPGLPTGSACWVVTIDLTGGYELCMQADGGSCAPGYQGALSGLDHFGWGAVWTTGNGGVSGPLIAGYDPQWSPAGKGTCYDPSQPCFGWTTGLGAQDLFGVGAPYNACFWFGGYQNTNGCGGPAQGSPAQFHFVMFTDCLVGCSPCPAPDIVQDPQGGTVCEGQSAAFSVVATGQNLTYQWYFEGLPIPGEVSSTLLIDPVLTIHAGTYLVEVADCDSVYSQPAVLVVLELPEIVIPPAGGEICEDEDFTFTVVASGQNLTYQWYFDGNAIPGATATSYEIIKATESDGGFYFCVVSNPCGGTGSPSAGLVVVIPPTITAHPQGTFVCLGDDVTFNVVADGTQLEYQWHGPGGVIGGATSSAHTITGVSGADAGDYYVVVLNDCDEVTSAPATLTVGGELAGRVTMDPLNYPMQNVTVRAMLGETVMASAVTNASGQFGFFCLPPGQYTIQAQVYYSSPGPDARIIRNYPHWDSEGQFTVGDGTQDPGVRIRYPGPVVLMSGMFGGLDTWGKVFPYLTRDPAKKGSKAKLHLPGFLAFRVPSENDTGYANTGYDNDALSVDDHDDNASVLIGWIEGVFRPELEQWLTPAQAETIPISIVGHSMGTLITRAYLTNYPSTYKKVHRIISLDGPHGGSFELIFNAFDEEDLNGKSSNFTGSTPTSWWSRGWNHSHVERRKFWVLYVATETDGLLNIVTPDHSAYGLGRVWNTWWGFWNDHFFQCIRTGYVIWVPDTHSGTHEKPQRLRQIASYLALGRLPYLVPTPGGGGAAPELEGHLGGSLGAPAASTVNVPVTLDTNGEVLVVVLVDGLGATFDVLDSNGVTLVPGNAESTVLSQGVTMWSFTISSTTAEVVTVQLTAGPVDAELRYNLTFDNGLRLLAGTSEGLIDSGAPMTLLAQVMDAGGAVVTGSSPMFTARVTLPDRSEVSLVLLDDGASGDGAAGDGVFGGTFSSTGLEGRYRVDVNGLTLLGDLVERSDRTAFAVRPTSATFSGPPAESVPDADGNGLFDSLDVAQFVQLNLDGRFIITATLQDAAGGVITRARVVIDNDQGAITAPLLLSFPATDIVRHAIDGPWTVNDLVVYDADQGSLEADEVPIFSTAAHTVGQFELPPPPSVLAVTPGSGRASKAINVTLIGAGFADVTSATLSHPRVPNRTWPLTFLIEGDESLVLDVPSLRKLNPPFLQELGSSTPVELTLSSPWGTTVVAWTIENE